MSTIDDVRIACDRHGIELWKQISRDDGHHAIVFLYEPHESFAQYPSTNFLQSEQQAIDFAYDLFSSMETEEIMKLLKNDKLFPHIRGVMLKDRRFTLHMSGKVNITELQGGDARAELHFTDHGKTAVINRNQLLKIISVYGDDTDDFKNAPIVLYGEHGKWFGKEQWGIRVDENATIQAAKKDGFVFNQTKMLWEKKVDTAGKDVVVQDSLIDDNKGAYAE